MTVIIDDLEVIAEPPETTATEGGPAATGGEQQQRPQPLAPYEVMIILRQQAARLHRVHAH